MLEEKQNDLLDEMLEDLDSNFGEGGEIIDVTYRITYKGRDLKITLERDED